MVDVCGMIARSWRPNTLCRPPEIGSLVAATTPERMSLIPGSRHGRDRNRRCGSAATPGRSVALPSPGWHCSRDRRIRSCSTPCPAIEAIAPQGRSGGWPVGCRRGAADRDLSAPPELRSPCGSSVCSASTNCCSSGVRVRSTPTRLSTAAEGPGQSDPHPRRPFGPFSGRTPEAPLSPIWAVCAHFGDSVRLRCGRDRRRSGDPTLFRRVLCRLSYSTILNCLARISARFARWSARECSAPRQSMARRYGTYFLTT